MENARYCRHSIANNPLGSSLFPTGQSAAEAEVRQRKDLYPWVAAIYLLGPIEE